MKKFFLICGFVCLSCATAFAADDDYRAEAVDLEEVAERMNTIKPEQFVAITAPVREEAHRSAQNLSAKEAAFLVSVQNKINRRLAAKEGRPAPAEISVDVNNQQEVEKFLTPDLYNYNDFNLD